ncbi:MAG: tRNA pseudouridine(55) synthase TruB [Candidatus Caldatribacteriota bacterium]|nr:tRNA pseudouridine(55) synthase TruB [Candidatus Caldatribacteriota bacterium]
MINGILNIFKPIGISSFKAVKEVRKILNVKKVGHTGTLDPNASGILLICLGQSTKITRFIMDFKKHYQGEMVLGITTDSQDSEGKIVKRLIVNQEINKNRIEKTFKKYTGIISQKPPMYSAIQHNGKRLYKLARKGIEVKRKSKTISIYQLSLLNFYQAPNPIIKFKVICSKGTYVRTLCDDIGKDLGCGAYMSGLTRVKVGKYGIDDSLTLEELKKDRDLAKEKIISMDDILDSFKQITVKNGFEDIVFHGGFISKKHILNEKEIRIDKSGQMVKVKNIKGELLSIAKKALNDKEEIIFKPVRVFNFNN